MSPTYDYICEQGHELELTHSFDTPTPTCPNCVKEMKKIIYLPAIAFKGSGFYSTDKTRS